MYGIISDLGVGTYPHRVRRDLDVVPRGNSRIALAVSPSQSAISGWGWGFQTVRGGIDPRVIIGFVPRLLELCMCGYISDLGMGPFPRLVRRNLDVGPRGNFGSGLAV